MAINDALHGIPATVLPKRDARLRAIKDARTYITSSNPDFAQVCALAGVDPEATHDRLVKLIAEAPSPEELLDAGNPRLMRITAFGRTATVAEWSKITGIAKQILRSRLADPHWTNERAVSEPHKVRTFCQKVA